MKIEVLFYQLFEPVSSTYTYIIADEMTREAAIIDPVLETAARDMRLLQELNLKLIYVLDTHVHADHITGAAQLRSHLGALTAVSSEAQVTCVDIPLEDGQELFLGNKKIQVLATPGHTNSCVSFLFEGMIFTGDALLIRGCGRTDFQQGNASTLYDSIQKKLYTLPENTRVYPGHDYRGHTASTIGEEKAHNARISQRTSREEFVKIMSELKLAHPAKIHEAVPANLACGHPQNSRVFNPQVADGIPEISVEELQEFLASPSPKKLTLIDVRRFDEFNSELGHIKGAQLITLGPELERFLNKQDREDEIVFICRSGGRSGQATADSIQKGFKKTMNLVGGMLRWNEKKYQIVRR